MRKNKRLMLLVLLCWLSGIAWGQQISGEVYDNSTNQPIAGANIVPAGKKTGTITDMQGRFSIDLQGAKSITVSYVDYESQSVNTGKESHFRISLEPSFRSLNQVVVVGYGKQKKANLTGAVSSVDVEKTLGSRPITDLSRGLQGTVAGLTITTPSGDIGTNPTIRLRGLAGTLSNPGAAPLILVDNVEFTDLRLINPEDIESISVLKDAASTSIYGSRATWGVILITTKMGKKGMDKSRISYSNNFSWSKPTTTPKIADAAAGAEMAFKALQRTNPNTNVFGVVGLYFDETAIQKMKDWQDQYGDQDLGPDMVMGRDFEIRNGRLFFYRSWDPGEMFMRDFTPQQKHNLTITGSSKKTGYNLNLSYLGQDGVLKVNPDKFDRFNANLGVTSSVTDWLDARSKVILSRGTRTTPFYFSSDTYDPWYYLYRWPAVYPYGTYEGKPFRSAITEVQQAKMSDDVSTLARISFGGTAKIMKGLTLDGDFTYSADNGHLHQTGGSVSAYNFWAGGGDLNYGPYTSTAYDRAVYYSDWNERSTFKSFATYSTKFREQHDFKLMAGTDVEVLKYWSQRSERRGLLNPDMGEPRLATGDQFATNTRGHWATQGYFGRVNYAFKNKLLLEFNGRFDGSSRFPENDKWAFFPSASAGYRISDEPFMDFAEPVLSSLKFRASYGSLGNQNVGSYPFLSTMGATSSNWLIGGSNLLTVGTPGLVSPSLTWERVATLDFGADARFFNNKMGATFDWYRRTTSGMVTNGVTVPSTLGTGAPKRNYGEMQTTGWELEVDWNHKFDNGIHFSVTGNLSDFKEIVTKYANTTMLLSSNYEGRVLGQIWGYQTDRFFSMADFQTDANGNPILQNGKYILKDDVPSQSKYESGWFFYGPGDVKYVDLNGDGKINNGANTVDDHGDLTVIGNSTPRYQYGMRLNADWKGFDLSMYVQGVGKRDLWANGPIFLPGYRPGEAWYQHQLDYWTPDNPNAFYPRPTDAGQSNNARNFLPQTKYMLNMAYTRLKNLTLGYTLPTRLAKKATMQQARIYVSGENLFETDHLKLPIDPEVDYTAAGLNDSNTFGRVYPYRRTFSAGIQVTF